MWSLLQPYTLYSRPSCSGWLLYLASESPLAAAPSQLCPTCCSPPLLTLPAAQRDLRDSRPFPSGALDLEPPVIIMASAASPEAADLAPPQPSAAQMLLQKHAGDHGDHHATVEDAPDDDLKPDAAADAAAADGAVSWGPTMSAKAAGKQPAPAPVPSAVLDTQSHELFPELGAPKKAGPGVAPVWSAKGSANGGKTNGAGAANGVSRASTPGSGVATPARNGPPSVSLPGRNVETILLDPQDVIPRPKLKRPLADVIKDINRRSRASLSMVPLANGRMRFEAAGPQELAQQALKDLVQQIGAKKNIRVPIPQSARAHIIGKQGSTIKSLQEKTGAKIQLPKAEDLPYPLDDDDDGLIDVLVEGNTLSAAAAREAILKLAGERAANVNAKMRGIPAEFYAFISDPKSDLLTEIEDAGVSVRVPPHQPWSSQPPTAPPAGQPCQFSPAANESHIQLAGDRAAVQAAKARIERRVEELHRELVLQQQEIPKGQQQFIIGERGIPMNNFFSETGCVVILPTDEENDVVSIIGPADLVDTGLERAMDLANNMQMSNYDISRLHRQASGGAAAHARLVTRYLRDRKEIERLEKQYSTHINTPFTNEGALPWEFYSRDGKNAFRAQSELKGIVAGHPPARMGTVPVDPFFHQYLRSEVSPRIRQDFGVHLVVPESSEPDASILLVYEGPSEPEATPYQIPQTQPAQEDIKIFEQGIRDAQRHILDLLKQQDKIRTISIDVPQKYHEKLRKFIKREQENRAANQPPVRVSSKDTTVTLRGPEAAVQSLGEKMEAFVEQEKEDEKERGFITAFDFPQKYANHLIGKGGSNIRELRDKFDVDIQVHDGKVELKGPKAKAEAARAHINALGRQLADETTHILKIEPKFHRELIGAQGATINRLQTRYKVLIFFPRAAKAAGAGDPNADAVSEAGKPRRQQAPDEVILRGPKKGADEARDEILTLFQYLKDTSFAAAIPIQQKRLPLLIGQGGAAMEELRQQTGAKIDIPNGRGARTLWSRSRSRAPRSRSLLRRRSWRKRRQCSTTPSSPPSRWTGSTTRLLLAPEVCLPTAAAGKHIIKLQTD